MTFKVSDNQYGRWRSIGPSG